MKLYSLLCVALLLGIVQGEGETSQCTVSVSEIIIEQWLTLVYTLTYIIYSEVGHRTLLGIK